MLASQRYEKIVELLNEVGIINIKELSKTLGVTEATIRRDCVVLEKHDKLIRVHGGAKSIEHNEIRSNYNDKKMQERTEHYEEKELVCKQAASYVKEGECIYLDGGTTIVPILKYLKGKHLKIVTPSTLIANAFEDDDSELFITGGKYTRSYDMTVGPLVLDNLKKFNFNHAFIGCTGIELDEGIVFTGEVDTMSVKQIAMKQALKNYLLIDSSKLFIKGFYGLLTLSDFDIVLCNDDRLIDVDKLPSNLCLLSE